MQSLQVYVKKKGGGGVDFSLLSEAKYTVATAVGAGRGEALWGGEHSKWSHEILITRFLSEKSYLLFYLVLQGSVAPSSQHLIKRCQSNLNPANDN